MFNSWKDTFRARRNRNNRYKPSHTYFEPEATPEVVPEVRTRPPTPPWPPMGKRGEVPREDPAEKEARLQKLNETMEGLRKFGRSASSNRIKLPQIPSFQPLKFSNMDLFSSSEEPVATTPTEIRRKPCPPRASLTLDTMMSPGYSSVLYNRANSFDPCAPVSNPEIHARARRALRRRYKSKFQDAFGTPDQKKRNIDLWCDNTKLDMKVLQDIVWVRELYAEAEDAEPSDDDIIRWYDAEEFDIIPLFMSR